MSTLREVPNPEEPNRDPNDPGREREEDPEGVDLWVMPYLLDPGLRPILIVVMAHVVAFTAPVLLLATRDRSPGPIIATLVLMILSYRGLRFEKRARGAYGAISIALGITWIFAGIAAWFANDMGIF